MDRNGVFLTVFVLYLLIVDCCATKTDINKTDSSSVVEPKDGNHSGETLSKTGSDSDSAKAGGKNLGVSSGASEGGDDLTKEVSSDGNGNEGKEKDAMSKNSLVDGEKEKASSTEGLGLNGAKDESSIEGDHKPSRKDNSRPEGCDGSFSCKDDKNKLVACLQVPGNESPDLSLLIQNKGTESLTVKITAPTAVHLEKTTVQLPKKEDEKVKISIGSGVANETRIILKAGLGICELNFRDIVMHNSGKGTERSTHSTRSNNYFTATFGVYVFLIALVLVGAAWACVKCLQRHGGRRYQKLDMELPVSSGGKTETHGTEGWDTNWGDSWDDEEAPMTPQLISNPSSKGLASRRSNHKDGWQNNWKD